MIEHAKREFESDDELQKLLVTSKAVAASSSGSEYQQLHSMSCEDITATFSHQAPYSS